MNRTISLGLCLVTVAAFTASAGDWRQFRGPDGTGISGDTGLPTLLDAHKSIAWKTALPGRGLSSPIIVGDRVFVTCSDGGQQERLHVLCFNSADGSLRWERQFRATGRTICHDKISVAAPTPVSDGKRLFALFSSNDLVCLDLDGNLVWFRGLMRDYPNASNSLGMSTSPVVADGVLIVQTETDSDSFVAGIDVLTGINRWKIARTKRANWTSPVILTGNSGNQLIALQSGAGISAIEPGSGREVWKYADGASTIPSSVAHGNTLYVPSRGITALQISTDGEPPKQLWRASQLRPATASPLVLGEQIFILNEADVLTSADTTAGNRRWQLRLKGPISASPVSAGGHLYFVNEKGLIQVVDPAGAEGRVISELDLGEAIIGTPSIGGAALYFRSDGHVWKISKS
ncbi:MAG: PQQ-binding-like beta-propeller repeat protein [Opitutaceae bacterium]|nr:PQQ-binding-like beta-propeller repeat protein [Verrucomicrobiales bacterium]